MYAIYAISMSDVLNFMDYDEFGMDRAKTSTQAWEHSRLSFLVFNISFSIYGRTHSASHCIRTIVNAFDNMIQ